MKSVRDTIFKCKDGSYVVGQKPNFALFAWIFFLLLSATTQGEVSQYTRVLAHVFGLTWSLLEAIFGVNLFRRIIGVVFLLLILLSMI